MNQGELRELRKLVSIWSSDFLDYSRPLGCTECPYAGHIELKECPDAYTEVSDKCGLYKHEPMKGGRE